MPSTSGGLAPSLDGGAILQAIPGLQAFPDLRVVDGIRPRPGPHLDLTDVVELAQKARALIAAGSKGIIVSQGTDTLEEVAFGVGLLTPRGVPIVFTGAMRDSTQAGADGPANVLGAVRVAASGLTSSMGVVVVINDEIHACGRCPEDAHDESGGVQIAQSWAGRVDRRGPGGDHVAPGKPPDRRCGPRCRPRRRGAAHDGSRQRRTADSLRPAVRVRGTWSSTASVEGTPRLKRRRHSSKSPATIPVLVARGGTKRSDAPLHLRIRGL